jgi:NADH dehydrogenase FAD-containing subunit
MSKITRRNFIKSLGAAGALSAFPSIISAAGTAPRVVVIGGGFAGATAAKYLRKWAPSIDVTLIEPNANYYSCVLSNLVLNNSLSMDQITFNYDQLKSKYGVKVINEFVAGVDATGHRVELSSGELIGYDRLIVAPGVAFRDVPGLDFSKVPHAWKAGDQTLLLKSQLAAMGAGGDFVLRVPKAPFRCPPGPYERAALVADFVSKNKPGSRVIVLDANPDIIVEKTTFHDAYDVLYDGIIEYYSNVTLEAVDSDNRIAITSAGEFNAAVLNVIPDMQAGKIITDSGLANDPMGRWAGVDPLSYESTAAADIHVIGDSQATGMPKAGHIANSEAKVCADAVIRLLSDGTPYAAPVTNSACYSPITASTATFLTAAFAYDEASASMKVVPASLGAASSPTAGHYNRMFDWADNLFSDTFA